MNYPQARRKARKLFGNEGDAQLVKGNAQNLFKAAYVVGVNRGGKFLPLGAGTSWDEAFSNVKEVEHAKSEKVSGGGEAQGGTRGEVGGGPTDSDNERPATSSVQRVKLT